MEWIVETNELSKTYNGTRAVDQLNLRIKEGEIFGFLGPNGAGKTTAILMILGLTEPTSGKVKVYGHDALREPLKVKSVAGYLPENVGFYEDLTTKENLRYITRLNGMPDKEALPKIEEILLEVGLSEVADLEVGKFSKGMKQRLGMGAVFVKNPKLAILDEPTAGIDPEGVDQILKLIVRMSREQNITMLVSSHLLYQVQRICERVGIITKGKMIAQGSIDEIGKEIIKKGETLLEVQVSKVTPTLLNSLKEIEGVKDIEKKDNHFLIKCARDLREKISRAIIESGSLPLQIKTQDYTLEEIYIRYFREG
ncbi:MAG: ABC transporter ATP-binding protein [Candidatus Aerophobetes bacterium]|nr:ABC transporter ATP-binding protein [Candidatus Aerophobetes bacterium]